MRPTSPTSTPATTVFMVLLIGVLAATAQAQDNALHDSARAGDKAKVETLLAAGADPNAVDDRGWTPLHRASLGGGHADIATLLLSRGASLDARDKQGRTPLHVAVHDGSNDVAKLLLANGADIDARDQYGTTPLDVAIAFDRSGQKGILELLESHILGPAEPRVQLAQLTEKIRITPGDKKTRWLAIRLANRMQPRPVVPEKAQRAFARAELLQKQAKNTSDHERAISAYRSALRVAPWRGIAYAKLAIAQESAGRFEEAIDSIKLYLVSLPAEGDQAREAQARIYAITVIVRDKVRMEFERREAKVLCPSRPGEQNHCRP